MTTTRVAAGSRLTWKDLAAGLVVAAVAALYVPFLLGIELPLVAGPRVLAVVLLVLGAIGCAFGTANEVYERGKTDPRLRAYGVLAGVIGTVLLVSALFTVVTASEIGLAVLAIGIGVLWLASLARHFLVPTHGRQHVG